MKLAQCEQVNKIKQAGPSALEKLEGVWWIEQNCVRHATLQKSMKW